jgi:hypothetical protein
MKYVRLFAVIIAASTLVTRISMASSSYTFSPSGEIVVIQDGKSTITKYKDAYGNWVVKQENDTSTSTTSQSGDGNNTSVTIQSGPDNSSITEQH